MDKKELIRTIKAHIWGPVGSVIAHVLIILAILLVAKNVTAPPAPDISVNVMDIKPMANVEEIKKEVEKIRKVEDVEEVVDKVIPPDVNDVSSSVDNNSNQADTGAGIGFGGAVGFGSTPGDFKGFDVASDIFANEDFDGPAADSLPATPELSAELATAPTQVRSANSMPPSPPGIGGAFFSGFSATIASVVIRRPATDAAFCSATRTTLVGSIMPRFTRSAYSPDWASKP